MEIALLGYGTIGSGVAKILEDNKEIIARRAGEAIELKYVLDLRNFPGDPIQQKVIRDINIITEDPRVGIVVECMGGEEPAHTFAVSALKAGKHFVTSNKALIAKYGPELFNTAKENHVKCLFEASVGGGIPIIRGLCSCLAGDVIEEIEGILNGTTNYMLTDMTENGSAFEDVLRDAQKRGFAEADPTADIEGHDACRKIAILTSLISGKNVRFEDIHCEGITKITTEDIHCAAELGKKVKLIALSRRTDEGYSCMVAPFMVGQESTLYSIDGVVNAVSVTGNMFGKGLFTGAGAGKLPTASAVVADIIEAARLGENACPEEWSEETMELSDSGELIFKYMVRTGEPVEKIKEAFGGDVAETGCPGAYIVPMMSGNDFKKASQGLAIRNVIRIL